MTRILTAALMALLFISCRSVTGSGNIITRETDLHNFDGVRTSGSIDVEVMSAEKTKVSIEADDNVMQYILVNVKDGLLDVKLKPNMIYHNINAKVYVSAPLFTRLYVAGSGSITSSNSIKDAEQINFRVSGSGDIDAAVDAPSIMAAISGSGTIKLQGRTRDFTSEISGSGDIKARDLLSENTSVKISGSGTAHVYASVNLTSRISGSGDVYYSGHPAKISGRAEQER